MEPENISRHTHKHGTRYSRKLELMAQERAPETHDKSSEDEGSEVEEEKFHEGEDRPNDRDELEQIQQEDEDSEHEISSDESYLAHRFDGTELVTGVFFGGEGCAWDSKRREALGITHILSVITGFEQAFEPDPDMVLSGHWKLFDRENRPTSDMLNVLDDCVDFVNEALGERGKICIISLEGVSRSPMICLAYLMKTLGMTLKSANELLATYKPEVSINRGFWRQLLAYEEHVRGCASFLESELPGTVLFERPELDKIIDKFQARQKLAEEKSPLSPTSATGIAHMRIGSPNNKRKALNWSKAGSPEEAQRNNKMKSPRNIDAFGPYISSA